MITAKEAAARLDGNQYREEGSRELWKEMKDAELVAVYGGSDDLVYFSGARDDEQGAGGGTVVYFSQDKPARNRCDNDDCPYFHEIEKKGRPVTVHWHGEGNPCWTYETDIPHETFKIMEDDEIYCIGIVFSLKDL